MSALLEVNDVVVRRGPTTVLNGISFTVEQGSITTILGSNGMGKSTALRTISGLHNVDSGSIYFEGQRIDGLSPASIVRAGVVHVPEGRQVFPGLTVIENLHAGAYMRSRSSRADVAAVLDHFPVLSKFARKPAGTLSGGQQQMVALARGMMARPKLLLLDEPTLGLAPVIVQDLRETIRGLNKGGYTVLLVEQNASMALEVADHGYLISQGQIVLSAPAAAMKDDPRVQKAYLGH